MHNISYRKEVFIQTEQSLNERNIYLIRNFKKFQKNFHYNWFFLFKLVKYDQTCLELLKLRGIFIVLISSMILVPFFASEGFAQNEQSLTISTPKDSYAPGEPIGITGLVETKVGDDLVTLRIFNPMNTLITIEQISVNNDGTFSGLIPTSISSPNWAKDGTYTIIADYYSSERATTQFEYGVIGSADIREGDSQVEETQDEEFSKSLMLEDYELGYELTGAEIIRITPDVEMKSLIIEIVTYSDGDLRITFPDDVIDTDEEGFFVLVDGIETNHSVVYDKNNWSFIIPFEHGTEEVEIIGTYVIPEFGSVVMLVLLVSIGTIIVISTKNKQIFFAR